MISYFPILIYLFLLSERQKVDRKFQDRQFFFNFDQKKGIDITYFCVGEISLIIFWLLFQKMMKKVSAALLNPSKGLLQTTTASYHENVIDHYENPRNVGSLDKTKKNVGTGLVGAPACGDVMKLQIELNDDGETIERAVFKTFGCGSAIASSSYATEVIRGMKVDEALKIKNTDIAKYLKLPPVKMHCSMLAEEAIKKAVEDVKTKKTVA